MGAQASMQAYRDRPTLGCQNCGAALVLTENERTTKCPYCASPQIVARPASPDRPSPVFAIPFALSAAPARELVAGWLRTRGFFRDPKLKTASIADMRGVYVPVYLYSAETHTSYAASIGEYYWETETRTETDSNGRRVTKTERVRKTEWRDLVGHHAAYVMDVLVTASRGIANHELEAIEPFDLRQMRRYDDAFVSGWITEEPTVSPNECLQMARQEAVGKVAEKLSRFMPGDRHEGLRHQTRLERETIDPMLVPVWILAALPDPTKPPVRIVVNGQSGEVYGRPPLSVLRIVVAIALVIAIIALVVVLAGAQ